MPGFIPIFILLGGAVAVVVLRFVPKGTGFAWLVGLVTSLAAWVVTLVSKSRLPYIYSNQFFISLGLTGNVPALQFDIIAWPIVMTLCSAIIGILIVSSARIGLDANSWEWARVLFLGALGIGGILADNILTSVMFLGLFDLIDLVISLTQNDDIENIEPGLTNASWRLVSVILFFTAYAWQISFPNVSDSWKSIQFGPGSLIIGICMVRLTMFPFMRLTGNLRPSSNGLFVTRFLVGFLITISILLKIPYHPEDSAGKTLILIYLIILALIASFWLLRDKEEDHAIGWQVFSGSMISAEYLYGFSASGILFSITIATVFLVLLLIYPVGRYSKILGILAIAGYSGLPYTPNSTGLAGFSWTGIVPGFIFLFPAILVFWSALRTIFAKRSVENLLAERWSNFISPSGLLFPVITLWIIAFTWSPNPFQLNISIQALIMTLGGAGLFLAEKTQFNDLQKLRSKIISLAHRSRDHIRIPQLGSSIQRLSLATYIQQPINFLTELFEGDGGIIWAILCLVLVVTLLRSFGLS